jgi:predicted transcriptional regulator
LVNCCKTGLLGEREFVLEVVLVQAFKLKSDYPIVAPAYAAQRSELAKSLGLGRKTGLKRSATKAGSGRPRKASAAKTAAAE